MGKMSESWSIERRREVLERFYREYAPEKLDKIESVLEHFEDRFDDLLDVVQEKYNVKIKSDGSFAPISKSKSRVIVSSTDSVSSKGSKGSKGSKKKEKKKSKKKDATHSDATRTSSSSRTKSRRKKHSEDDNHDSTDDERRNDLDRHFVIVEDAKGNFLSELKNRIELHGNLRDMKDEVAEGVGIADQRANFGGTRLAGSGVASPVPLVVPLPGFEVGDTDAGTTQVEGKPLSKLTGVAISPVTEFGLRSRRSLEELDLPRIRSNFRSSQSVSEYDDDDRFSVASGASELSTTSSYRSRRRMRDARRNMAPPPIPTRPSNIEQVLDDDMSVLDDSKSDIGCNFAGSDNESVISRRSSRGKPKSRDVRSTYSYKDSSDGAISSRTFEDDDTASVISEFHPGPALPPRPDVSDLDDNASVASMFSVSTVGTRTRRSFRSSPALGRLDEEESVIPDTNSLYAFDDTLSEFPEFDTESVNLGDFSDKESVRTSFKDTYNQSHTRSSHHRRSEVGYNDGPKQALPNRARETTESQVYDSQESDGGTVDDDAQSVISGVSSLYPVRSRSSKYSTRGGKLSEVASVSGTSTRSTSGRSERITSGRSERSTSGRSEGSTSYRSTRSTSERSERSTSGRSERSTSGRSERSISGRSERSTSNRSSRTSSSRRRGSLSRSYLKPKVIKDTSEPFYFPPDPGSAPPKVPDVRPRLSEIIFSSDDDDEKRRVSPRSSSSASVRSRKMHETPAKKSLDSGNTKKQYDVINTLRERSTSPRDLREIKSYQSSALLTSNKYEGLSDEESDGSAAWDENASSRSEPKSLLLRRPLGQRGRLVLDSDVLSSERSESLSSTDSVVVRTARKEGVYDSSVSMKTEISLKGQSEDLKSGRDEGHQVRVNAAKVTQTKVLGKRAPVLVKPNKPVEVNKLLRPATKAIKAIVEKEDESDLDDVQSDIHSEVSLSDSSGESFASNASNTLSKRKTKTGKRSKKADKKSDTRATRSSSTSSEEDEEAKPSYVFWYIKVLGTIAMLIALGLFPQQFALAITLLLPYLLGSGLDSSQISLGDRLKSYAQWKLYIGLFVLCLIVEQIPGVISTENQLVQVGFSVFRIGSLYATGLLCRSWGVSCAETPKKSKEGSSKKKDKSKLTKKKRGKDDVTDKKSDKKKKTSKRNNSEKNN